MSFSYDPNLSTDLDKVRFNIGDTDSAAVLVQDEEINYLLTQTGVIGASIICAENIAAKYSRFADQKNGDLSKNYSQISEQYRRLSKDLAKRGVMNGAAPLAPAISKSEKQTAELDTDRVEPNFTIGMDDNERIGSINDIDS